MFHELKNFVPEVGKLCGKFFLTFTPSKNQNCIFHRFPRIRPLFSLCNCKGKYKMQTANEMVQSKKWSYPGEKWSYPEEITLCISDSPYFRSNGCFHQISLESIHCTVIRVLLSNESFHDANFCNIMRTRGTVVHLNGVFM